MSEPVSFEGHPWVIALIERLKERDETVAFAESCTGGLLSAMVTRIPGVSRVFLGSCVSYSNESKIKLLGVPEATLHANGAVSLPTALAMAKGARERFGSTWSVSITGIAGPDGGTPDKPVGTVCFAVVGPGIDDREVEAVTRRRFPGTRREVQFRAARYALAMLLIELGFSKEQLRHLIRAEKTGKRR